jgi:hypothetical protein
MAFVIVLPTSVDLIHLPKHMSVVDNDEQDVARASWIWFARQIVGGLLAYYSFERGDYWPVHAFIPHNAVEPIWWETSVRLPPSLGDGSGYLDIYTGAMEITYGFKFTDVSKIPPEMELPTSTLLGGTVIFRAHFVYNDKQYLKLRQEKFQWYQDEVDAYPTVDNIWGKFVDGMAIEAIVAHNKQIMEHNMAINEANHNAYIAERLKTDPEGAKMELAPDEFLDDDEVWGASKAKYKRKAKKVAPKPKPKKRRSTKPKGKKRVVKRKK